MSPLNSKGNKVLSSMKKTYGSTKKAKNVMYAMKNSGKLKGIDSGFYGHMTVESARGEVYVCGDGEEE